MNAALTSEILWSVFSVLMVITAVTTLAFYYHWGRYSRSHIGAVLTITIYTVGLAFILLFLLSILAAL